MNWAGAAGFVPAADDLAFDMRARPAHRARLAGARRAGRAAANCSRAAWSKPPGSWRGVAAAVAPARARGVGRQRARRRGRGPRCARAGAGSRRWRASPWSGPPRPPMPAMRCCEADAGHGPRPAGGARRLAGRAVGAKRSSAGWPARRVAPAAGRRRRRRARSACMRQPTRRTKPSGPRPACCGTSKPAACRWRLPPIDRVLTRRIRAMLDARGVAHPRRDRLEAVHHPRGRKRDAGACAPAPGTPSSDAVIDWLKNAPVAWPPRRARRWSGACAAPACASGAAACRRSWATEPAVAGPAAAGQRLARGHAARRVRCRSGWTALRELLQATRPVDRRWNATPPGAKVIAALRPGRTGSRTSCCNCRRPHGASASRSSPPGPTTCWRTRASCPSLPRDEQVVILPFNQLLGRPFAALVLAGCDELRLPPSPEPARHLDRGAARRRWACPRARRWRPKLRAGWRMRCKRRTATCSGARSDDSGEPRAAPAPWCRRCSSKARRRPAHDPRAAREVAAQPDAAAAGRAAARWPLAAAFRQRLRGPAPLPLPLLCAAPAGPAGGRRDRHRTGQARLRQLAARGARAPSTKRCTPARSRRARRAPRLLDITAEEVTRRPGPGRRRVPALRRGLAAGARRLPGVAGGARGQGGRRVRARPRASTRCSWAR